MFCPASNTLAVGWTIHGYNLGRGKICLFSKTIPTLGSTRPPVQCRRRFFPGVNLSGRALDHSRPWNTDDENGRSCTSTPPYALMTSGTTLPFYPVSCTSKTRKVHIGVFRAAINTVARAKPKGALRRSNRTWRTRHKTSKQVNGSCPVTLYVHLMRKIKTVDEKNIICSVW